MIFKFIYGNHANFGNGIHDTMQLLKYGFEESGHELHFEQNVCPGCTNIIVELFTYDFLQRCIDASKTPGTRFVIIATEFITGKTFNDFKTVDNTNNLVSVNHYEKRDYWLKRYTTFIKATELACSVWHLNKIASEKFKKELSRDVLYMPHCYVSKLANICTFEKKQDIDFLFTGTLTAFRESILTSLLDSGYKCKFLDSSTPPLQRLSWVERSKIALNLKQNSEWKYSSNSRYYYHLCNDSLMISHKCEIDCDLSIFITEVEETKFLERCKEFISNDRHVSLRKAQTEKFNDEKPNEGYFKVLIDNLNI